jgi:hypothetical protein
MRLFLFLLIAVQSAYASDAATGGSSALDQLSALQTSVTNLSAFVANMPSSKIQVFIGEQLPEAGDKMGFAGQEIYQFDGKKWRYDLKNGPDETSEDYVGPYTFDGQVELRKMANMSRIQIERHPTDKQPLLSDFNTLFKPFEFLLPYDKVSALTPLSNLDQLWKTFISSGPNLSIKKEDDGSITVIRKGIYGKNTPYFIKTLFDAKHNFYPMEHEITLADGRPFSKYSVVELKQFPGTTGFFYPSQAKEVRYQGDGSIRETDFYEVKNIDLKSLPASEFTLDLKSVDTIEDVDSQTAFGTTPNSK